MIYVVWRSRIADYRAQDRLNFSTPFVNTTVVLFESDSSLDAQTYASVSFSALTADVRSSFFTYILTAAVASLLLFFGYKFQQKNKVRNDGFPHLTDSHLTRR